MDSFRDFASELEPAFGSHAVEAPEVLDDASERRMQVKAYNYWTSLLDGRDFPSIEDLEPASIAEFAKHSVLLDFTSGPSGASTAYLGAALRRECDVDPDNDSLADVPSGSLLSRLTDYYAQIVEGRAPVGIETEFVNQRGEGRCYRGILMPFSSDGDTVDFVYGVFNWNEADLSDEQPSPPLSGPAGDEEVLDLAAADEALELDELVEAEEPCEAPPEPELLELSEESEAPVASAAWTPDMDDAPGAPDFREREVPADSAEPVTDGLPETPADPQPFVPFAPEPLPQPQLGTMPHLSWQDGPLADSASAGDHDDDDMDEAPALAEWLTAARATAEDAKAADGRSRQALYRALSEAYDFACAAAEAPDDYQQLLDACGIQVQARAPMTAVAKLVFGADYDKARLTEYAAALSFAARQGVEQGGFFDFIDTAEGGLKGLVEAERRLRRPDGPAGGQWRERAVSRLRQAEARPLEAVAGNGEFALVLVRRDETGTVAPIAAVSDPALLEKALRKAAS